MSQSRLEFRVGIFVLAALVLLAAMVLLFSRGLNVFASTIDLRLKSGTVGGIKRGANVLMAGVAIGRVGGVELDEEGTNVIIHLKILARYKIRDDARFEIEQSGFLGDQYVAIYPGKLQGRVLNSGDEVFCHNPFNLQETVARAAQTITTIGQATTNVDAAVSDVRRYILTEEKLNRLGAAIENFAQLTEKAHSAVAGLNALVASNALPVTSAVSNLHEFSQGLGQFMSRATALVTNNEDEIAIALKNVEIASAGLTNLLRELQAGQGVAARLINDKKLADDLAVIANNLSVTASNLNRGGLWSILWKKKEPRTNNASRR